VTVIGTAAPGHGGGGHFARRPHLIVLARQQQQQRTADALHRDRGRLRRILVSQSSGIGSAEVQRRRDRMAPKASEDGVSDHLRQQALPANRDPRERHIVERPRGSFRRWAAVAERLPHDVGGRDRNDALGIEVREGGQGAKGTSGPNRGGEDDDAIRDQCLDRC
jgi:hypothetical protein